MRRYQSTLLVVRACEGASSLSASKVKRQEMHCISLSADACCLLNCRIEKRILHTAYSAAFSLRTNLSKYCILVYRVTGVLSTVLDWLLRIPTVVGNACVLGAAAGMPCCGPVGREGPSYR